MKLKELKSILFSTRGNIQFAIVYDREKCDDIDKGSIEYIVEQYKEKEVKHIEAYEDNLIITI